MHGLYAREKLLKDSDCLMVKLTTSDEFISRGKILLFQKYIL
jgi:hypothetical protein